MAEFLFFFKEEDRADAPDLGLDHARQGAENLLDRRTRRNQFKDSVLPDKRDICSANLATVATDATTHNDLRFARTEQNDVVKTVVHSDQQLSITAAHLDSPQ